MDPVQSESTNTENAAPPARGADVARPLWRVFLAFLWPMVLANLRHAARSRVPTRPAPPGETNPGLTPGTSLTNRVPEPFACWTFEEDARDSRGALPGELRGGARVEGGRLVLDGREAFVQTAPLGRKLTEKTLEAWVAPASFTSLANLSVSDRICAAICSLLVRSPAAASAARSGASCWPTRRSPCPMSC